MKVIILSKALVVGAYRSKLNELARLGVEVVAVVPPEWREGGSSQRMEPVQDALYDLVVTPLRWNGHFHVHYYPDLPNILRTVRPDLLHADEEPYNIATLLAVRAARRQGIPSIFFSWQNLYRRYPPPFSFVERAVYRLCPSAIAGSEEVVQVLRAKGYSGSITVVPQFGVDPTMFRPGDPDDRPFTVGYLNRMVPEKGPIVTLDAFQRLPSDLRMIMVGDGPLFSSVKREIQLRRLTDRVTLQSRVPSAQVPDLLRSMDVLVLPSISTGRWKEQFGRVLIEAMASGVPVVASSSGEIPNVLGQGGLIVDQGSVEALTSGIRQLYQHPEVGRELGRLGRERVLACFTQSRIAEMTQCVYQEALTKR